ncbi:MAG: 2-amino-4-hydroxy-6-hydroxymethyldihydropteridine diphosphokinase [Planctomycetota bacterium]|nr:MAG: 2-amino-4-hydroxy-6-hydroxymethyldihydropteridine diphosphokinase [Planctomycetota bacterium]
MAVVFLGLGSNLGDREGYLNFAVTKLETEKRISILDVSCILETPPLIGGPAQGPYLNIVLSIDTDLSPEELLHKIQAVENEGDRVRNIKWGPRTIDVDILLYDNEIIKSEYLEIPHNEMMNRDFVLIPLVEIFPEGKHPISGIFFKNALDKLVIKSKEKVIEFI